MPSGIQIETKSLSDAQFTRLIELLFGAVTSAKGVK